MILITDPQFIWHEISIINALFIEGLETLHIRKPDACFDELVDFISKIDIRFHSQIMIHSHYRLMDKFHLKGLHFTEKTKHEIPDYRNIACVKSQAIHHLNDLENINRSIDYILLSPIFPSISKNGYFIEWNKVELISELKKNRSYRIVALGGVSVDNIQEVKEIGFDDYALLGSIWEPVKNAKTIGEIIAIYKSCKNEFR
jgi:thiamine-phosphate pyrophosphorylase